MKNARQPSLFDPPPTPKEERPINLELLRRQCQSRTATLNRATYLPWRGFLLRKEIKDFHYYGSYLPKEEFAEMLAEFESELERTKQAHIEKFGSLPADDAA